MRVIQPIALWIIAISLAVLAAASAWSTWVDGPTDTTAERLDRSALAGDVGGLTVALQDLAFQACLAYVVDYWQGTPVGSGVCRDWHPEAAARWDHAIELGTDAP